MSVSESKKYIIIGFVGLLVVGIAAFFLMREHKLPSAISSPLVSSDKGLFDVAPWLFDQFIYIDTDDALKKSLEQYAPNMISGDFQTLLQQIDTALTLQYTTGDLAYSLLFLQWEEVDIVLLQDLGLVAAASGYSTQKINKNTRVYGTQDALTWYGKEEKKLRDDSFVDSYIEEFDKGNYNMWFVSRPKQLPWIGIDLVQQLSSSLKYTSLMTRLDPVETKWKLALQFAEGVVHAPVDSYKPLFGSYTGTGNILYLEMSDIIWFFNITKEKFMNIAPMLLGESWASYSALLGMTEYEQMYDVLHGHIGLVMNSSVESPFGLGVHILFNEKQAFDIFKKLGPLWKNTMTWFLGTGNIQEEVTDTEMSYSLTSPLAPENGVLSIHLYQQDDGAFISLFDPSLTREENEWDDVSYSDETVMSFKIDSTKLQAIGGEIAAVWWVNALGQSIFVGDVQAKEKEGQIVVNFEVKK